MVCRLSSRRFCSMVRGARKALSALVAIFLAGVSHAAFMPNLRSSKMLSLRGSDVQMYTSLDADATAARTARVLAVKEASGLTFDELANTLGLTNTYTCQLFFGQAQLKEGTAVKLKSALPGLSDDDIKAMQGAPMRGFDEEILKEPNVYRTCEPSKCAYNPYIYPAGCVIESNRLALFLSFSLSTPTRRGDHPLWPRHQDTHQRAVWRRHHECYRLLPGRWHHHGKIGREARRHHLCASGTRPLILTFASFASFASRTAAHHPRIVISPGRTANSSPLLSRQPRTTAPRAQGTEWKRATNRFNLSALGRCIADRSATSGAWLRVCMILAFALGARVSREL